MTSSFTQERTDFPKAVADYCRREASTRGQRDALTEYGQHTHNQVVYTKMAELGWLGLTTAKEFGGSTGTNEIQRDPTRSNETSSARRTACEESAMATRTPAPALRRRPQLSEDVADHVRGLIMSGEIRPGDFVRLDETAAELGVSVTPVREALLTLRGEGMVELVPHRGYVVSPLSRDDVRDTFWLQGVIAVELAVRAARVITGDEIDELESFGDSLRSAVERQDAADIAHSEFEFHRHLNVVAGAGKLAWFLHNAVRYTPHRLYAADRSWGELAVDCHDRLIIALRAGDLDQVTVQTRRQFDDGAERLMTHLDRTGIWS